MQTEIFVDAYANRQFMQLGLCDKYINIKYYKYNQYIIQLMPTGLATADECCSYASVKCRLVQNTSIKKR